MLVEKILPLKLAITRILNAVYRSRCSQICVRSILSVGTPKVKRTARRNTLARKRKPRTEFILKFSVTAIFSYKIPLLLDNVRANPNGTKRVTRRLKSR